MTRNLLICFAVVITMQFACSSTTNEGELLLELANMDKEAIFDRAEELFLEEEYADARRYFSFIYDTFPNDPLGHKAALRVADTYAMKNDLTSLTEARLRFRDFANRYPNDPDRDYALLMLGQTYAGKKKRPDRDLAALQESLDSYNQLIALYPDSAHVDVARERIVGLREILAEHEFQVATYYARNHRWRGVAGRLSYLKEHYPEYSKSTEVDTLLAEAQGFVEATDALYEKYLKEVEERNAVDETEENE
jgi:outer membrane protein assembly factor BamD